MSNMIDVIIFLVLETQGKNVPKQFVQSQNSFDLISIFHD